MKRFPSLNISTLASSGKDLLIARHLEGLEEGSYFILEHTQDPASFYFQFLEGSGKCFSWEYLESGPLHWRVKITKGKQSEKDLSIGEIAAGSYQKAEIFQRLGLNYCCAGNKTLQEACEEAGIRPEILEQFYAEAARHKQKKVYPFEAWEVGTLADYIINTHHSYARENISVIKGLLVKVAREDDRNFPELQELTGHLSTFLIDLEKHMQQEEELLFPLIKRLTAIGSKQNAPFEKELQHICTTIHKLVEEHKLAGSHLMFLKKLTHNYRLPARASDSCTYLFAKLIEFENDLIQHIHLENNILFPKAIGLKEASQGSRPKGRLRHSSEPPATESGSFSKN